MTDKASDPMSNARNWEPTQCKTQDHADLRHSTVKPKGFKQNPMRPRTCGKRSFNEYETHMEVTAAPMEEDAPTQRTAKRAKLESAPHRPVSGKSWKAASARASAPKAAIVGTSWERKMADKALRASLGELKAAAAEAVKAQRKGKALAKKAAMERKQQNREKSQVSQKITNAATLKKMMKGKKSRKLLKTADTN